MAAKVSTRSLLPRSWVDHGLSGMLVFCIGLTKYCVFVESNRLVHMTKRLQTAWNMQHTKCLKLGKTNISLDHHKKQSCRKTSDQPKTLVIENGLILLQPSNFPKWQYAIRPKKKNTPPTTNTTTQCSGTRGRIDTLQSHGARRSPKSSAPSCLKLKKN